MPRCARALFSALLVAGCGAPTPLEKYDEDRLHCQAQMYYDRTARGRTPPNWNLYDYCMRLRGYSP